MPKKVGAECLKKVGSWFRPVTQKRNRGRFPVTQKCDQGRFPVTLGYTKTQPKPVPGYA